VKEINIFCFGFGQVAKNFIKKLSTENYKLNLSVTSRSESSKKTSNGIEYNNYLFDDKKFDRDLLIKLNQATHILISIPPINKEDIVLMKLFNVGIISF
jgi:homoserine dehydrogenase